MQKIDFRPSKHLTLGVELEVQLLHPETLDLYPYAIEILKQTKNDKIKPEIFQSMIEINTDICADVHEVKKSLSESFQELNKICENNNIKYSTTGTHPFARYSERILYPSERYHELIDRNQWIARRLSIFGLHVHIGMRSKDDCIKMMNFLQHFLPQLAALSSSSPFWQSKETGLQSSRLSVFEASPTTGHCDYIKDWDSFANIVNTLKNCNAIKSTKDLWWDIRPAPHFGSLEIRICDGTATFHELLGIVSYIHILAHFYDKYQNDKNKIQSIINSSNSFIPLWLIRENKWRALRYGLDMEIIKVDGSTENVKIETLKNLKILENISNDLKYDEYINYIKDIIHCGNSSSRQIKKYYQTKSLRKVTKMNSDECYSSFINYENQIKI